MRAMMLIILTMVIWTECSAMLPPGLDLSCTMRYKAVNPNADFPDRSGYSLSRYKIFAGRDFTVDCKVTNLSQKVSGGGKVRIIPPDEWTVHGLMDFTAIGPGQSVAGTFTIRAPARSTYRPKVFPVFAEMKLTGGAVITRTYMVEIADPFMPALTIHSADSKAIKASIGLKSLYPGQEIKAVSAYSYMVEGIKVEPGRQTFDFPAKKAFSLTYSKDGEPGFALRAVSIGMKADEHIVRLRSVMEAVLPLGIRSKSSGLWMNDFTDGQTVAVEVGGKQCRQTLKSGSGETRYMYFAASPNVPVSGKTRIVVTYFDAPEGSFALQYDSQGEPYKESEVVRLEGTNQWKRKTFVLPDIMFQNRQSAESDFRLAVKGADLSVSDIAVSKYSVD